MWICHGNRIWQSHGEHPRSGEERRVPLNQVEELTVEVQGSIGSGVPQLEMTTMIRQIVSFKQETEIAGMNWYRDFLLPDKLISSLATC